jgi:outer membrane protein TolC
VAGYADYLDALRNRLTVQTILATSARDYALARLGVHRALGGTWIEEMAGVDLPAIDAAALPSDPTGSNR